jgi:hypothetical protein
VLVLLRYEDVLDAPPICRAHYRQVAGVRLAEDDHTLVQEART